MSDTIVHIRTEQPVDCNVLVFHRKVWIWGNGVNNAL